MKEVLQKLMKDKTKADETHLPHIRNLDWEFNLSSIFVEVETPLVNQQYHPKTLNSKSWDFSLISQYL